MKKWLFSIVIVGALLVCGCGVLSPQAITPDNPLGFVDPCQAMGFFNAGLSAANTAQAVGVATGNPALIGGGVLGGVILTLLGGSYLKGRKK